MLTVPRAEMRTALARDSGRIDASYSLIIKDLEPLSRVTGNRTFNGLGTLRGSVLGDYANLSMEGRLGLRDFFYGNADSGIFLRGADVTFQITDLAPERPLTRVELFVLADVDRMLLNRRTVDSLQLSIRFSQEYATYTAHARYDTVFFASFSGIAAVEEAAAVFTLNRATLAYQDYAWDAEGGASVGFSQRGMALEGLVLRRDSQEVRARLFIGVDGGSAPTLRRRGWTFGVCGTSSRTREDGAGEGSFSGTARFSVQASGTLEAPLYVISVEVVRGAFRGIPFGTVTGEFSYRDRLVTARASVLTCEGLDAGGRGLHAEGTIPINLAPSGRETPAGRPPVDLVIRARSPHGDSGSARPDVQQSQRAAGVRPDDAGSRGGSGDRRGSQRRQLQLSLHPEQHLLYV